MVQTQRPRLAVWKFASCDGCQLSLLDLEHALLELADTVEIAFFREASDRELSGTYDLSLVDGSITTPEDLERIRMVRARSRRLVSIGACATAGGIQALRNFVHLDAFRAAVYAKPEYVATLATSTAISENVPVDFELRGCPVNKDQLLEVLSAFLNGRRPAVSGHSVCVECKLRGNVCVMVTGTPCLGPVTHAGCGALCPTYARGCYGCFGPMEHPNVPSLIQAFLGGGLKPDEVVRELRTFNAHAPEFEKASVELERSRQGGTGGDGAHGGGARGGGAQGGGAHDGGAREDGAGGRGDG